MPSLSLSHAETQRRFVPQRTVGRESQTSPLGEQGNRRGGARRNARGKGGVEKSGTVKKESEDSGRSREKATRRRAGNMGSLQHGKKLFIRKKVTLSPSLRFFPALFSARGNRNLESGTWVTCSGGWVGQRSGDPPRGRRRGNLGCCHFSSPGRADRRLLQGFGIP